MLNDDDAMTAIRESLAGEHMTTPVEAVLTRGRRIRRRRRMPVVGVLAAGATAVVLAFTPAGLIPGGSQTALAAWTVARSQGGTITITLRELRDPAGLQRELREDGLPAAVYFGNGPRCTGEPSSTLMISAAGRPGDSGVLRFTPGKIPAGRQVGFEFFTRTAVTHGLRHRKEVVVRLLLLTSSGHCVAAAVPRSR